MTVGYFRTEDGRIPACAMPPPPPSSNLSYSPTATVGRRRTACGQSYIDTVTQTTNIVYVSRDKRVRRPPFRAVLHTHTS